MNAFEWKQAKKNTLFGTLIERVFCLAGVVELDSHAGEVSLGESTDFTSSSSCVGFSGELWDGFVFGPSSDFSFSFGTVGIYRDFVI